MLSVNSPKPPLEAIAEEDEGEPKKQKLDGEAMAENVEAEAGEQKLDDEAMAEAGSEPKKHNLDEAMVEEGESEAGEKGTKQKLDDEPMIEEGEESKKQKLDDEAMTEEGEEPKKQKLDGEATAGEGSESKKQKLSRNGKEFEPRSYQKAVFDVALRRNTIAVLGTGAGKTMIAIMLIREMSKNLSESLDRRLIVFLAPTVHLVTQQCEVIKMYTNLEVGLYYGDIGVDSWNLKNWKKEVATRQVMVMTPQVLLDALRKAFLTLDLVLLMIFDECHRATGNHPYTRIMKEFYHKSSEKLHVFGMTASPVIRKGVSSSVDCEDQLSELEAILDSKIFTVADRSELDVFVPEADEVTRYYDQKLSILVDIEKKMNSLWNKFEASVHDMENSPICQYKDAEEIVKQLSKRILSCQIKISLCLDNLGLVCTHEAVKACMETIRLPYSTEAHDFSLECMSLYKSCLGEVLQTVEEHLVDGYEELLQTESGCQEAIQLGYISPKMYEMIQVFKSFGLSKQVRCLIFVERIITARVIDGFIKKISSLSHFTVAYLTGGSSSADALTPKEQKNTLDLFRAGKVNLLFTTDVAEEGLDIPDCSCVIRFDLPKTVRSYVQSRGRARQAGSHYVNMLERGNFIQRDLLFGIIMSKHSMMDTALSRDPDTLISRVFNYEEIDVYIVESTGATITTDSSISLVYKYCEKLPRDKYFTPRPDFQFTVLEGIFQCILTLPPNAAFQRLVGPVDKNSHVAKQLLCLEACKKLHQLGALDDHLLPFIEEMEIEEDENAGKAAVGGPGTTKRKELHSSAPVDALSGTWMEQRVGVTLQAYKLKFKCDQPDEDYGSFVLLIDAILDHDVGSVEMDLHLVEKMVKASVSPCGPIQLDMLQVEQAKLFQELFFNGLFAKLFLKDHVTGLREFLLKNDDDLSLWTTPNMYMLLPLELDDDVIGINWKGINATASVVRFLRSAKLPGEINLPGESNIPPVHTSNKDEAQKNLNFDVLHLANETAQPDSLKDKVVLAIHTGKIYSVLEVVAGSSAESPFDGANEKLAADFSTFSEYFSKKYSIVLRHPAQPLLLLKHSHNPHNLLSASINSEGSASKKRASTGIPIVKKAQYHAHMPPELLINIENVPLNALKSFYLLPSVMHRMASLMLASQLRREIGFSSGNISSALILEAITTLRCCEDFSLERLELLGDSVLKYALSCHLFMKFPEKHEGQLSARRSRAVCNATLHKLGMSRKIQCYIRDAAFEPRRWIAPGQLPRFPAPCKCEIDDGADSTETPLKIIHESEDNTLVIGKACDSGHRWLCSKTVSDCVEALIGAYYVDGGLDAAFALLNWFGFEAEIDLEKVEEVLRAASIRNYVPHIDQVKTLESKLHYEFSIKGLLLEAMTHASYQDLGAGYCYQRLEFLGDSVLDLLITQYLFKSHKHVDPGELTDLRSASVNNENFAQVAIRHKIHQHLQHGSGLLLEQVTEYVKSLEKLKTEKNLFSLGSSTKCPKVLGDLLESIAGAMFIDTNLSLDRVWEIFEPLLSPIVTPDSLDLPPLRQLTELCSHLGYFLKTEFKSKGDMVVAMFEVQLEEVLLVRQGCERNKKAAKGIAAVLLLKDLEGLGFSHSRHPYKRRRHEEKPVEEKPSEITDNPVMDVNVSTPPRDKELVESKKESAEDSIAPVLLSVKMAKGGPRTALYDLCKKCHWPMPAFEPSEGKPSVESICNSEGVMKKTTLYYFVSDITMHVPGTAAIRLTGDRALDKKSSQDSAAMAMLYELEKHGRIQIKEV